VIIGYANTLEVKIPEQDPNRRLLDPILAAAGRAAQLTRSLLAFSRKESIEPRPAELNELVRRMHEFLKRVIGEDIELVTRQSPVSLDVHIDEGQIEQVLMNLATNARDAMPKGGILSLETERVAIAPDAIGQHGVDHAGTWARLSVSDTGSGMDEVTRLRMFDPFFTTKAAGKGTGLGLAIVYGIIRQHRGQINAYSEPGRGTTFRIYLPVAGEGALAAEQAAPSAAGLGGAETILVAEDDESLRLLFSDILTGQGYSVIQAGDGQEAVERHREHAGKVDLLLMDLIMPRMSGKAAFDLIRAACPTVRVLFTSGYTADIIQSRADLDEGVDLVMKPIATRDLLMKIRSILDRT
jgi:CheY-like chemotaxis protein